MGVIGSPNGGWLALLFPQPFGLNLLMLVHLVWFGIGMYYFLRKEGLDHLPALLGALAVACMPKLFSHLGAGHVTLVFALAWTPWLLLAQHSSRRGWWQAGTVLGLIALADLRWAAMAGLLWLAFGLWVIVRGEGSLQVMRRWILNCAGALVFACLLSAVLLLPLLEYTRLSTRSMMTAQDNLTLSLPPLQLLGLLTPPMGATVEWVLYPGAMVLVFVLMSFGLPAALRKASFWLAAALAGLIYAMGSNIPGLDLLTRLPGLSLIRVPPRALFIVGFALAAAAACTLDVMMRQPELVNKMKRINPLLLLVGLVFFEAALTVIGWVMTREFPLRFGWGAIALLGAVALIFALRSGRIQARSFALVAIAWLLADLTLSNAAGLDFRPVDVVLASGSQAAAYIRANGAGMRVYSPSYSIPQQTAALAGLELADGVDPLQLAAYAGFMNRASGVAPSGYSVTLPPMLNGDPANDNKTALPDALQLGMLHVGYVVADYDLAIDGLIETARFAKTRIYINKFVLPFAWVQDPSRPAGQGILSSVEPSRTANKLTADASGPGLLVFSEISYPGWVARVDGQVQEIQPVGGILRGVSLPAGNHHVEMAYQPVSLFAGLAVSLAAWLFNAGFWWIGLRENV